MSTTPSPALPGIALLEGYLAINKLTIEQFSKRAIERGRKVLERTNLGRVLSGKRRRIGVEFAEAVHLETDGAVPWNSWCQPKPAPRTRKRQVARPAPKATTAPAPTRAAS